MPNFHEQIREWCQGHPQEAPAASLTTCPRRGRPAQRVEAPNEESYITCGHCGQITFDQTGEEDGPIDIPSVFEVDEPDSEFYAQAQPPAPTCCVCTGPHPTWRCPQIGAELMRARHIPPLRASITASVTRPAALELPF